MSKVRRLLAETVLGKERAERLPPELLDRLKTAFEGKRIPRSKTSMPSDGYLDSLAAICRNDRMSNALRRFDLLLKMNAPEPILESEIDIMVKRIGDVVGAAGRAHLPSAYMMFLSRPELDTVYFTAAMEVFADRRDISFTPVDPEGMETGSEIIRSVKESGIEGKALSDHLRDHLPGIIAKLRKEEGQGEHLQSPQELMEVSRLHGECLYELLHPYGLYFNEVEAVLLQFKKSFTEGGIRGYVLNDPSYLREKGYGGIAIGHDFLLASDNEGVLQHELQHIFDSLIGVRGGKIDREVRARLGAIAFSEKGEGNDAVSLKERLFYNTWRKQEGDDPVYLEADYEVVSLMCHGRIGQGLSWRERAMHHLNRFYKFSCGLTYDQIVKPFLSG